MNRQKLPTIDWRPVTSKRVSFQNPREKTSAMESVFNEIAWIDSLLATSLKISFNQGVFPVNVLECSWFLQVSLT